MSKRPKKAPATWADIRRAALDDAARRCLLDPEAPETVVAEARAHLSYSSEDALELAAEVLPMLSVETLRRLRADLSGVPEEPSYVAPMPAEPVSPELAREDDHQDAEPVEQVASRPTAESTKAPVSQTVRTLNERYLPNEDSGSDVQRLLHSPGGRRRY